MWTNIKKQFPNQQAKPEVVRKMIECGMRVSEDRRLFIADVEQDYTAVARAVGVDRRVVRQTVDRVRENRYLYSIFSKTSPLGTSLVSLVPLLGYNAIEVEADPRSPGIMAAVAEILSRHGTVVRQALADDPDMVEGAKMTIVAEGQIPGKAIEEISSLGMVRSLRILK